MKLLDTEPTRRRPLRLVTTPSRARYRQGFDGGQEPKKAFIPWRTNAAGRLFIADHLRE
jgi:hypothetical protein